MSKKIAILTERLKTGFGVDLVVDEQAKRLSKKNQLTVFAIDQEEDFISKASYPVARLWIPLFFNPLVQDWKSFRSFKKHKHLLEKYDVFLIHTPTFNPWIPLLKKMGKKVIVCYYGNSPSYGYQGLKKYRQQALNTMENLFYFRFADKVISISSFLRESLPLKIRNKTLVSHLSGDHLKKLTSSLSPSILKSIQDKFFINPKKDLLITYIGRLDYRNNPYKNTQEIIQLKKKLKAKTKKNVKVFTIGFPENGIEKELYKEGVLVAPRVSARDLVAILKTSYLLISPSRWEGFNLPLIEAQTLGIPVIAYKLGAHPEVVNHGKSGFLVDSFRGFKNKVKFLIENPKERDKMSEEAIKFSKKFTWNKNVSRLESYL